MASTTASGFGPDQDSVVHVGEGVTLKGEISVSDVLVVDGVVEGDVSAQAILVGPSGVIRGRIAAVEADIAGAVSDHVEIEELLVVRSTGRVEGRVAYGEIELEKGAVLTGDLSSTDGGRAASRPPVRTAAPARGDGAAERSEPIPAPAPEKASAGSIDRLNEAVRAARSSGAKAPAAEPAKRNVLRSPLLRRKASA